LGLLFVVVVFCKRGYLTTTSLVFSLKTHAAQNTHTPQKTHHSRAKRLKKLHRLLTCRAAQSATARFKTHTWALVGIILAAHITCFVVLVLQINSRYKCVWARSALLARFAPFV
jgi:hypothetical protein